MKRIWIAILATSAMTCGQARAQSTDNPQASEKTYPIGDIVVTAQKREQNLQDVPIAVSALSAAYLEQREITSIASLTSIAPNVLVETTAANKTTSSISIRGGSPINPQLYFEPSVGVYMDGVYIAKAQGALFDVADIERIEVLRGPQGTLYGRNTIAGAVNIVTAKPSGELAAKVEASYGNYDYWRARGSVDLPALGIFSAKISGQIAKRDGFYKVTGNAFTNEAASLDSRSGMVQLRARPSDSLIFDYVFDLSVNDQQANSSQLVNGTGALAPFVRPRRREMTTSFNSPNFEYAKNWGHAFTAALDIASIGTLKSITALRKQKYRDALDLDGTPLSLASSARDTRYKQFSQELQLTGGTDRLNYVLGAYYFYDKGFAFNPQSFFYGASVTDSRFGFTTKSYAAYAQLDYKLTDALTLTGGLRYTHERKTVERFLARTTAAGTSTVINLPAGTVPPATFSKMSPFVTLSYEASPDINVYARYTQGFRSGGFNGVASAATDVVRTFQPQVQDTYEIGFKSRLIDRTLQLNVAAFQNDVKDLQLSVFVPGLSVNSLLVNAGKARVRGVEAEIIARPGERFLFQASVGYLDGKYRQYLDGGVNVAANRSFPSAPKFTVSTSVDWTAIDSDRAKLNLIADLRTVSKYYLYAAPFTATATQDPAGLSRTPDRTVLDLRAVFSQFAIGPGKASLSFWGKNVLNDKSANYFIPFGPAFLNLVTANYNDPRTYGVTLGLRY